jgi:hypothetical protein
MPFADDVRWRLREAAVVRDLVLGTALFVVLVLAAAVPGWSAGRLDVAGAATARPAPRSSASPITSGPGFTLCTAAATWRRPTDDEQRAHLTGDHRFDGAWETADTAGYERFHAPAVFYDGSSASGMSWIMHFTGLWNVWDEPATRPKTCWTQEPQVFLFGYEALAYDAQDPKAAVLRVRPAPGYQMVILTGPIRPRIDIVADRKLYELVVPAGWVTPAR